MKTTKRLNYWDNIKGILIILVVLGHFLYGLQNYTLNKIIFCSIYMFHMPAFVFISGYFSKSEHSRSIKPLLNLVFAYLIVQFGFMLYKSIVLGETPSLIHPYHSNWYLMALIVWRITIQYAAKIKHCLTVSVIVSILSMFCGEIDNNYAMIKIITFYPFFIAGYLFSKEKAQYFINLTINKKIKYFLISFLSALTIGLISYFAFKISLMDLVPSHFGIKSFRHIFARIGIYSTSAFAIVALLSCSLEKPIPIISKIGKNSFAIYVLHRPFTLIFTNIVTPLAGYQQLSIAIISTIILCLIIGTDFVQKNLQNILNMFTESLTDINNKFNTLITITFIVLILIFPTLSISKKHKNNSVKNPHLIKYRIMNYDTQNKFNNSFKILFAGDLILLEDQVKRGYNGISYNFDEYFKYTTPYIKSADIAIAVFEGPMGGCSKKNYSSSNYDDGKKIYLNFPDEFADAVKKAGFDLVTTASNHILDMDEQGAKRTIHILNTKKIDFIGTFLNKEQKKKNHIKIIEKNGIRLATISYTYGINHYHDKITNEHLSYITTILPKPKSKLYNAALIKVKQDFEQAKRYNPDFIVVLPHWGTQFTNKPDEYQKIWRENFIKFGADIILGDHTHSVQPVFINRINNKNIYTLYSPGNFANIYRKHNGDASAMVEVFIDKNTKKIIGGAIIPMWTESSISGNYRALPIYDILHNKNLRREISTFDLERIKEVQKHITSVMLGQEITMNMIQPKYFFDEKGFIRNQKSPLYIDNLMKQGQLYKLLSSSKTVCFIGDSVTAGSNNNGVPWYEPIKNAFSKKIINKAWGSATTNLLITKYYKKIKNTKADLFIIAIGTNDVRYRNPKICAMTEDEYISNLTKLRYLISKNNPNAKFVFIAPWYSTDGDKISKLKYEEKLCMNNKYTNSLKKWTQKNKDIFINPNIYIKNILDKYPHSEYMVDYVHPNAEKGVQLYSKAVLLYK